jgi:hypothetical protein
VTYSDPAATAMNMVIGAKRGQCTLQGDSGAPVYTVWGDGRLCVKGVNSVRNKRTSGGLLAPCEEVFTDIWDAWLAFPRSIKLP